MSDIEARLRRLGETTRADEGSASFLPLGVARRVKRRRLVTVATGLMVATALAFGGTIAVGAFEPPREIPPAVPPEAKPSCADRIDFVPTHLPQGWVDRLQPGRGGGLEAPGALGHYGNDAGAGTPRKALGGFADLLQGRTPYRQTKRQEIEVLGAPASLGDIHEGYSVEFARHGCDLTLVAYGISRDELARFAKALRKGRG